jgi:hypothetical protein
MLGSRALAAQSVLLVGASTIHQVPLAVNGAMNKR